MVGSGVSSRDQTPNTLRRKHASVKNRGGRNSKTERNKTNDNKYYDTSNQLKKEWSPLRNNILNLYTASQMNLPPQPPTSINSITNPITAAQQLNRSLNQETYEKFEEDPISVSPIKK